jgi:phospholipase C
VTDPSSEDGQPFSRRQFLTAAGAAGALVAAGRLSESSASAAPAMAGASVLPSPGQSGIEHIVVVCMENRSFDHFLGWVPGATGRQAGLSYPDDQGVLHPTHHLQDWQGCGFNDPDHSYGGGRIQLDGGKLDGFRRGGNDDFALGYYLAADLPVYSSLVHQFTVFDHWFCGILAPTYPNRFYTHAATTDRIDNSSTPQSSLPTIWDRLSAAGVSATYYYSDLPFLALWGSKYTSISRPIDTFFQDAAAGRLSAYSYLDPIFLGEAQGTSNDDHPHADIRRGQALVGSIVNAVLQSPTWSSTVLIITYDEWGGFFDHVLPPVLPDNPPLVVTGVSYDLTQAGFRVPAFVVSPFSRAGRVVHGQFNHASIPRFVEWRFGLPSLQPRDAAAPNLAQFLDFGHRNPAKAVPATPDPGPHVCGAPATPGGPVGMANSEPFWAELAASPLMQGWPLAGR